MCVSVCVFARSATVHTIFSRYRSIPESPLDLMDRMLTLDPSKRVSAAAALRHPFLAEVDASKIEPPE